MHLKGGRSPSENHHFYKIPKSHPRTIHRLPALPHPLVSLFLKLCRESMGSEDCRQQAYAKRPGQEDIKGLGWKQVVLDWETSKLQVRTWRSENSQEDTSFLGMDALKTQVAWTRNFVYQNLVCMCIRTSSTGLNKFMCISIFANSYTLWKKQWWDGGEEVEGARAGMMSGKFPLHLFDICLYTLNKGRHSANTTYAVFRQIHIHCGMSWEDIGYI